MADQIITGRVYLAQPLAADEAAAFVGRMTESAVKNKIWINTCGHFKSVDVQDLYPAAEYLQEGYIPFEITDSEQAYEANRILSGIWYRDEDFRIADLSASGLGDIQSFLEELIKQETVSNISISFDLAHGYPARDFTKCTIHANAFCTMLMTLPDLYGVPSVEFNVVKDQKEI